MWAWDLGGGLHPRVAARLHKDLQKDLQKDLREEDRPGWVASLLLQRLLAWVAEVQTASTWAGILLPSFQAQVAASASQVEQRCSKRRRKGGRRCRRAKRLEDLEVLLLGLDNTHMRHIHHVERLSVVLAAVRTGGMPAQIRKGPWQAWRPPDLPLFPRRDLPLGRDSQTAFQHQQHFLLQLPLHFQPLLPQREQLLLLRQDLFPHEQKQKKQSLHRPRPYPFRLLLSSRQEQADAQACLPFRKFLLPMNLSLPLRWAPS
jgi:hypothetical protein